MAELIGNIPCAECRRMADYMSDKRNKVYVVCKHLESGADTGCGVNKYQTNAGQLRLKARFDKEGVQVGSGSSLKSEPEKKPEPRKEQKPPETPKRRGLLSSLLSSAAPWEIGK